MARIRLTDLNESKELDHRAMQEIRGGAVTGGSLVPRYSTRFRKARSLLTGRARKR